MATYVATWRIEIEAVSDAEAQEFASEALAACDDIDVSIYEGAAPKLAQPVGAPAPVDQIANAIRMREIRLVDAAGRQAESIHDWLLANGWTPPA